MYISLVSDCEVNKSVKAASFTCVLLNCSFYSPYMKRAFFFWDINSYSIFSKPFLVSSGICSYPLSGKGMLP